jgi:hypothetical protein
MHFCCMNFELALYSDAWIFFACHGATAVKQPVDGLDRRIS